MPWQPEHWLPLTATAATALQSPSTDATAAEVLTIGELWHSLVQELYRGYSREASAADARSIAAVTASASVAVATEPIFV